MFKLVIGGRSFSVDEDTLTILHEAKEFDSRISDIHNSEYVTYFRGFRRRLYAQSSLADAVINLFVRGHELKLPELPQKDVSSAASIISKYPAATRLSGKQSVAVSV